MFDIGWSELALIGVVSLIVVGPKDLPDMFRTLGRLTSKARMMARDFQRAMEDAADDSGLKDISRDLNSIGSPMRSSLGAVNRKLDDWDDRARKTRSAKTVPVSPPSDTIPTEPVAAPSPDPVPGLTPAPHVPSPTAEGPAPVVADPLPTTLPAVGAETQA